MEVQATTDANPETGEWPADYDPPSLEELGSVWEETRGMGPGSADGMSMTGMT